MKIALIGYGKMGKAIEELSLSRNHKIICKFNSKNPINLVELRKADVAIEFSTPTLVADHIRICAENQIPVVVGTTAWSNKLDELSKFVLEKQSAMLFSSNFSLGVNIFFELNRKLAKIMSNHLDYSVAIKEIHHLEKLDSPSGTALSIANDLMENHKKYSNWQLMENSKKEHSEKVIPIIADRVENVPGTHIVSYQSSIDDIEIKHEAHNRVGFAFGALLSAEFLQSKKGIFTMSDVLNF